jgi:L-aminopeptidase/D-esterase-like protein
LNNISRRQFGKGIAGALTAAPAIAGIDMDQVTGASAERRPSLTDVDGILVGHFTMSGRPTGCTVVTSVEPVSAGVDVRGGAPGTRETDLLRSENTVEKVNAVFLSGGSAFGLEVATGITRYLEEQRRGFQVGAVRVPIVCGAILFDLGLGDPAIRPDANAGYEACKAAGSGPVPEGNVGAGAGATVGKLLGSGRAMKAGLGSWSITRPDGLKVGAVVAVNCVGDVVDPANGRIVAGARKRDGHGFEDTMQFLRGGSPVAPVRQNTAIAVVATNAQLDKPQCNKVAQMAQDAFARCIYPAHTPWDGDSVFALATGAWQPGKRADAGLVGALAADMLARAILRGVTQAESWGNLPAQRDFQNQGAR